MLPVIYRYARNAQIVGKKKAERWAVYQEQDNIKIKNK